MKSVVILSAVRTAIGNFNGSLKSVPVSDLGALVIFEAINRAKIKTEYIDEVIMGCVLQAGTGQNVARQSSIKAGINETVPAFTINHVCGSGLRSVELGATSIKAEEAEVIVVGGMESMSSSPFLLHDARTGLKMGDKTIVDSLIKDGLWCAINDHHMGITAENVASLYGLTRKEQDSFAIESQEKAIKAQSEGKFEEEIVPVSFVNKGGKITTFDKDEYIRTDSTSEKLSLLKPAFIKNGTVTAGNASGINDGAAALVIASESFALENQLKPLAKILSYANVGLNPTLMGLGPIEAIRNALKKAELLLEQIEIFELNEAFASQSLAVIKELNIDKQLVNVNGGAIALGHPIGASGARILVSLLHEMKRKNNRYGLAALCIGGGQGIAMVVENIQEV